MSKHTPGPWCVREVHPGRSNTAMLQVAQAPGERGTWTVAQIVRGVRPISERQANARLIAAAPDLPAACKGVLNAHENERRYGGQTYTDDVALRTVIAKAEGK